MLEQLKGFVLRLPVEQAVPYIQSAAASYLREAKLGVAADTIATSLMNEGKDIAALDFALEDLRLERTPGDAGHAGQDRQ